MIRELKAHQRVKHNYILCAHLVFTLDHGYRLLVDHGYRLLVDHGYRLLVDHGYRLLVDWV